MGPLILKCVWPLECSRADLFNNKCDTQTSSFFLRFSSSLTGSGIGMSRGAFRDSRSSQLKDAWQETNLLFSSQEQEVSRKLKICICVCVPSTICRGHLSSGGRILQPALPPGNNNNNYLRFKWKYVKSWALWLGLGTFLPVAWVTSLVRFWQKPSTWEEETVYVLMRREQAMWVRPSPLLTFSHPPARRAH